jgi:hypothetical protein
MSDIVERLRADLASGLSASLGDTKEAAAEIEKLRAALGLAIDAVEHWASYASPYFQEKHDLAGDLQKLRAALGETQ